jgi:hypothetical protein
MNGFFAKISEIVTSNKTENPEIIYGFDNDAEPKDLPPGYKCQKKVVMVLVPPPIISLLINALCPGNL